MWSVLSIAVVVFVALGAVALALEGIWTLKALYDRGGEHHWDLLGARLGLLHGHDDRGQHVLDGQQQGVWLHVCAEGAWMVVRGRIEAPMPAGLRIRRRDQVRPAARPGGAGVATGNPIADALLLVEGDDASAARLLRQPELVEALMAVVHADPGSVVEERYVVLRYPDALGRELEGRCARVVALVHALRRANQHLPCPQQILDLDALRPTPAPAAAAAQ